jgi:protein phosphatase
MSVGKPAANPRVAAYYAAGAILVSLLVVYGWPLAGPLMWPALSMAVLVAAYLGVGPGIYGKRNGILPHRTRLVMAPTLLGQQASLQYYRRKSRPWDEAVPGLLMGRVLTESECDRLIQSGATAVLDLTAEFSEPAPLRSLTYLNVPLLDLTAPTAPQLQEAVDFIRDQIASGGTVYVHCKVGYSRTATAVGAYLMASGRYTSLDDVLAHLRAARPGIVIRPEAVEALRSFQAA